MVARVRPALDIARPFQLIYGLGHRLLAHPGQLGEPRDRDAFLRHKEEDVRGARADVVEPCFAQRSVKVLCLVLVDQPEQEPDCRALGEARFHR